MKPRFADTLWLVLKTIPIPTFIFLDQRLVLSPSELAVYLYFCFLARVPKCNGKVRTSVDQLARATSYTPRQVDRALMGLLTKQFLGKPAKGRTRAKGAQSTDTEFEMCSPRRGGTSLAKPILSAWESSQIRDRPGDKGLRSLLSLVIGNAGDAVLAPAVGASGRDRG